MQLETLKLKQNRIAAIPIIQKFMEKLGLISILKECLGSEAYARALETLIKSILLRPESLYRIKNWTANFDDSLVRKNLSDDMLARALDCLYKADRASLMTKLVVGAIDKFSILTEQIHNDSTSISFSGEYSSQDGKAVQLKRGHSKDHRPDLKQLVYSLSVTRDGAIPIHFKTYDGNVTDDKTHLETWSSLRGILGKSDFIYVADSKLCVSETLGKIDRNQGYFVTILPRTRSEAVDFANEALSSNLRWQEIFKQKSSRKRKIDHYEVAIGFYQMREGYRLYWFRSSEKKIRDKQERETRIIQAKDRILSLNEIKRKGPKTEVAVKRAVDKILNRYGVKDWLKVLISSEEVEKFKQTRRGKSNDSSLFKRMIHYKIKVAVVDNFEAQNMSAAMDGTFPLVTNKNLSALETLKAYKYQPRLEKRHSLLKSVLQVAPVFLKKNDRIEALMFTYFIAQLVGSLIERKIRIEMEKSGHTSLPLLPEGRHTKTPTVTHIFDLFQERGRQQLLSEGKIVKIFSDPLTKEQLLVLKLLGIPATEYQ
jgi:transposase